MLEQKRIQLAMPVEQIQIPMYGIADAPLTENLRDLWTIEFDIDKYMDGELNPCYKYILPLAQIQVEDIGWFILQVPPEERDDGNRIHNYQENTTMKTLMPMVLLFVVADCTYQTNQIVKRLIITGNQVC